MLIVLTSEKEIGNEAMLINQLFDAGLDRLHLRKPTFSIDGYRGLLTEIDNKHYQKIMLHEHHELAVEFGLKGIHIQEQPRFDLVDGLEKYVTEYKSKGMSVSSSFHDKLTIAACNVRFDYVLLSPVFTSISKENYEGKGFDVTDLDGLVVGMGGINENTIKDAFDLGFGGVGVLGGVWDAENPMDSFNEILNAYRIAS